MSKMLLHKLILFCSLPHHLEPLIRFFGLLLIDSLALSYRGALSAITPQLQ